MFYIRTSEHTVKNVSNEELSNALAAGPVTFGVNDYSIEFKWNGMAITLVDRDNPEYEILDSIETIEEFTNLLISHGIQILPAVIALSDIGFNGMFIADKTKLFTFAEVLYELQEINVKSVEVYNIKWDTDGKDIGIPTTMTINVPAHFDEDELENFISDKISDESGFCHYGFEYK